MPLGKEVGLGLGPDHIVLDGYPVGTQPSQQPLPTFGPRLLWPNGPTVAHLSNCLALVHGARVHGCSVIEAHFLFHSPETAIVWTAPW